MLQVSSDDPKVYLSFLDLLEENRNEKELSKLVHIGASGLHYFHNFIKHGGKVSGWNVNKVLSSLHRIIDEQPSRRADYEALTQAMSSVYLLKFCAHLSVKNVRSVMRARGIWFKIFEIIEFWKGFPKNKKTGKIMIWGNASHAHRST